MRETLHLTDEEIETLATSSKSKKSVHDEVKFDYEQSFFQDLENFLRSIPTEKEDNHFILGKHISIFLTSLTPPGFYEVSDIENDSGNLMETFVSIDTFTKKITIENKHGCTIQRKIKF